MVSSGAGWSPRGAASSRSSIAMGIEQIAGSFYGTPETELRRLLDGK